MGVDLYGKAGYVHWSLSGWNDILSLAEEHGWIPTQTGPPRGIRRADWPGWYNSNDGQLFYARDAARMADALGLALEAQRGKKRPVKTKGRRYVWLATPDERKEVKDFIKFCRAGSFRIW